jgi:tetratricopeptide (TPR) repeat protein
MPPSGPGPHRLSGQTFVFAGSLRSLSRREAAALVEAAGGEVRSRVTRETRFLVAGEGRGERAERALMGRKQRLAERQSAGGGAIEILDEHGFLALFGVEATATVAERFYRAADLQALYRLSPRVLRALEQMRILRPVLRTHADRYYAFGDLLILREVSGAMARGTSLGRIARRLRLERQGQLKLRLETGPAAGPAQVLEFRHPAEVSWSADDWYAIGCQHDEEPGEFRRAIHAYERSLDLDPHHIGALVNLGNIQYRLGLVEDARRLYEKALALDPQNPNVHYNLGNVFDDLAEYATAIRFFEAALRLRPENADAHFNLGLVHDRLGNVEQVREHMLAYLRLDPHGEMADVASEYLSLTTSEDEVLA